MYLLRHVCINSLTLVQYYPCFHSLSSPPRTPEEKREVLLSCFTSSVFPTTTTTKLCAYVNKWSIFLPSTPVRREYQPKRDPHPQTSNSWLCRSTSSRHAADTLCVCLSFSWFVSIMQSYPAGLLCSLPPQLISL